MPLPNYSTTDHPGSQFGPTLNELLSHALEKVESITITKRGRDVKDALLGIKHLLEKPSDCDTCHYIGVDGSWIIKRSPDGVCGIHGVPLHQMTTRYGLEGECNLCCEDLVKLRGIRLIKNDKPRNHFSLSKSRV